MDRLSNSTGQEFLPIGIDPTVDRLREQLQNLIAGSAHTAGELTTSQIETLLEGLPRLTEEQIVALGHKDSLCPICFTPFLALLAEEEHALAMDSPAHPVEHLGVTRLAQSWQCGHLYCRRDISTWITESHGSCPTCRRPLADPSSETTDRPTPPERSGSPGSNADHSGAEELLHQLEDRMMEMFTRGGGGRQQASFGSPFGLAPLYSGRPAGAEEEDRSEYSGMYS